MSSRQELINWGRYHLVHLFLMSPIFVNTLTIVLTRLGLGLPVRTGVKILGRSGASNTRKTFRKEVIQRREPSYPALHAYC